MSELSEEPTVNEGLLLREKVAFALLFPYWLLRFLLIEWSPGWMTLKDMSRTWWVRSSFLWIAIVPILASWLSMIDGPIPLTISGRTYEIPLDLPFSWKAFYFGAVSFSIALFLLYVGCPEVIRRYDRFSDFRESGREGRYLLDQLRRHRLRQEAERFREVERSGQFFSHSGIELAEFANEYCSGGSKFPDAGGLWKQYGEHWDQLPDPDDEQFEEASKQHAALREETIAASQEWLRLIESGSPLPLEVRPDQKPEAFWRVREVCDDSYSVRRLFVSRLLLLGYCFHIAVAVQGFLYVYKVTLR